MAVLAPTAAVAQSAGDEQYADPLAGQDQGSNNSGSGSQGGSGADGQGSDGEDSTGTPVQAQDDAPQATANSAQAAGGQSKDLPRTGLDVAPLIAIGAALLTTGLVLHLALGPARRRRRGDPVVLFDGTLPPLR